MRFCDLSNLADIQTDDLEGHVGMRIMSSALTTNCDFGFTASHESAILWDLRTPNTGYRVDDRSPKETGLIPGFLPIESVTTLPIVGASSLVNTSTQAIFYNLETLPRVSRFNSHYCPPNAKSCSLTANNRLGVFLSTNTGEVYLVDLLNRHSYKLREGIKDTNFLKTALRAQKHCAIISSDGKRAVTCTDEVLLWDLCPSENLSFDEILVLDATVNNSLENQVPAIPCSGGEDEAGSAEEDYQRAAATEETLVSSSLSDSDARESSDGEDEARSDEEAYQQAAATEETLVSASLSDSHARESIEMIRQYILRRGE